jgi:peptidoglycan/xylan/chitin deacetylase (PgdA/CDA1 family)
VSARAGVLPVLMYHAVGQARDPQFGRWVVSPELLAAQLQALDTAGFSLVGLTEALPAAAAGVPVVALTFDDGYADLLEAAVPVLTAVAARATVYPVTDLVGTTATWLPFPGETTRRLMDWSELGDVAAAGFEIGSHGSTHDELDTLSVEEVRDQLTRSHEVVGARIGRAPTSFCYPHGYHNSTVRRAVAEAGFTNACEVGHGLHSLAGDPLRIRRVMVTPDLTPGQLVARLSGTPREVSSLTREALRVPWRTVRRGRRTIARHRVKA